MAITLGTSSRAPKSNSEKLTFAQKARELIVPVSEVSDYLTMCVYGRNGSGKTTFIGSSDLKTLIIDCNEKGTLSVRRRPNVFRFKLTSWEQTDWIYWFLRSKSNDYQVIGIDTITGLAVICMKWILKEEADRDFNRDPLMPDKRHWGKLGIMIKEFITRFTNLEAHVIFTAQEKTSATDDEEEGGTTIETHPELSPSPRSTLLGAVDIIGRIYTREVEVEGKKKIERRMLVGPHPRYVAKDRTGALGLVQRRPTLASFIEKGLPAITPGETDAPAAEKSPSLDLS